MGRSFRDANFVRCPKCGTRAEFGSVNSDHCELGDIYAECKCKACKTKFQVEMVVSVTYISPPKGEGIVKPFRCGKGPLDKLMKATIDDLGTMKLSDIHADGERLEAMRRLMAK